MTDPLIEDLVRRVEALEQQRELTLHRLNIVEGDGTVRMVLSNTARAPDPVCDGTSFTRDGGNSAGVIFYNDEGDECGGLVFAGRRDGDRHRAGAALLFDQFKQDQVVGITHGDSGDRRTAGLSVWDRRDEPFPAIGGVLRLFAGKTAERAAVVEMKDGTGRVRLRLGVPHEGAPRVEILDEDGTVVAEFPDAPT